MGIKARLTSWQVCGKLRNFTTTMPGKYGVADFGADFDYREITAHCSIYPKHSFTALVSALDNIAAWLDPTQGLHQLVFDDVPDRYFMARLNDAVDCERLIRSAGSFELKFFCPDPFGYALTDETFSIAEEGTHTVARAIGNIESLPVYRIEGVLTAGASNYISITTNGTEMKIVNASLSEGETLIVDTDKMTAYVVDENGETLRNGLPYLQELNFPTLAVGDNTVTVEVSNATLTELQIQATQVYAEAEFYDLTFSVRKEEKKFDAETADVAMAYALADTEWSVGTVSVTTKRTWTSTEKNALSILRSIANLHGGDLVFDCPNRRVHLLTVNGKDSGALFAYKKNMKSIERIVDTRSLVTRLYAVGADGLTFADINGGKPYLEDYTYSKEVRITTLDCSSFTNPYQMKEFTAMRLAEYCKPTVSYVLNAMDLSVLTGYEHEAWNLGDYVRVEDKELGLSVTTRIVRREYNLQEPWNTVLELSTTLKNLGSSVSTLDTIADSLEGTSVVSNNDIRELVPFNHLRNSRADDDMAYWVNSRETLNKSTNFAMKGSNGIF